MKKKVLLPLLICSSSIFFSACGNVGNSRFIFSKESKSEISNSNFVSSNSSKNPNVSESNTDNSGEPLSKYLSKVTVNYDNVGIYAVVTKFSNLVTDKGNFEFLFTGEIGSPQENSQIDFYSVNYHKETTGYEIQILNNDVIYQNLHNQDKLQVTIEFGGNKRAGHVKISYTPDKGEKILIYSTNSNDCVIYN